MHCCPRNSIQFQRSSVDLDAETPDVARRLMTSSPGSITIAGHFSQAVHHQLRILGGRQGRTVQFLLTDALNMM